MNDTSTTGPELGDQLLDRARADTGLDDFGPDSWREGYDILCAGLAQPHVRAAGRAQLGNEIVSYLANRLRVTDHHRRHPELAATPIEAPIIVLGLPRTGTTALSYLLDTDPQWRWLLNWEAVQSVPPPNDTTRRTDPRCTEMLEFQRAILPTIDPPPPHWEWADGPTECTFILAQDFRSAMWENRMPNPAYREFISTCEMAPAYDHHRRVLQILQSQTSGRWCLKMPAHALYIDTVLATYPDARFIWTHRDPATATASFLNLAAFAHGLTLGDPDLDWIAETYPPRLVEQVARPLAALAGRDVFHLHYADVQREPLAQMEQLYAWLDADLTATTRQAMLDWLDAETFHATRGLSAGLDRFGLERSAVLESFGNYLAAFPVELDDGD